MTEPNAGAEETQASEIVEDRRGIARVAPRGDCFMTLATVMGFVVAQVVDYSADGIGLDLLEPLRHDSTVTIAGVLSVAGVWMELSGTASVAHCRRNGHRGYRVGLAFKAVEWVPIEDPRTEA